MSSVAENLIAPEWVALSNSVGSDFCFAQCNSIPQVASYTGACKIDLTVKLEEEALPT